MRWIAWVPPVPRQLEEDVDIDSIKAQGVLLFENDRRQYRPARLHQAG